MKKEDIEQIVHEEIRRKEKLGEQAGGSGHLSYVTYDINSITTGKTGDGRLEIKFTYTTYTETEFTYYPDNPPQENQSNGRIIIDKSREKDS